MRHSTGAAYRRLAARRRRISVVVIANDFTAMNVALATIEKDFNTDVTTVQWVTTAGITSVDESQACLAGGII